MALDPNIDPSVPGTGLDALRRVRWLAERCALPPIDVFPQLASKLLAEGLPAAAEHCCWWARHPNPKGKFAAAARHWPEMTDEALISALMSNGYNGFLYLLGDTIIGHFFFQRHGAELHAFSGWVAEPHRDRKLLATFSLDFLAYASQRAEIVRARVGTGDHPVTHHLLAPLIPHLSELGWRTTTDGWVDFGSRENLK